MPRGFLAIAALLVSLSLIPFAVATKNRAARKSEPRRQIIPDMDQQPKFKAQQANPLFADGRAMRPEVPGTVARGRLDDDDPFAHGKEGEEWTRSIPLPVTETLLKRGRERYDIYCSPCHGLDGGGAGIVSVRAESFEEGTWTPPPSFHTDLIRERPAGHLYHTISHGIRSMPGYAGQITPEDRWAIVAYLRALQRSRSASPEDVPADILPKIR
ncbi:MAG: cytochrome c [Candidatus Eisenbacteria bacterium]|nr:cytochrome c [Candidatus Eisenbacteria bacterium]